MNKKAKNTLLAGLLALCAVPMRAHAGQLEVETSDVITVVTNCMPYAIGMAVVVVIAIVVAVMAKKLEPGKKKLVRVQSLVAGLLAALITCNLLCQGPLKSLLDVVANPVKQISTDTRKEANELIADIAGEGIVMVKNNGALPLSADVKKLNVFGWGSTQPCYGGTGSGAVDTSNCVTLLQGIENGGYELNKSLEDFYTSYATARGEATMSFVDWTLPEPTVDMYSQELLDEAKSFSDTALIVITRIGGEGTDLPTDFGAVNADGTPAYMYNNNSTEYADFEAGQHYLELSKSERNMVELVCNNFDNVIVICNSANAMELGWVNEFSQISGVLICPGAGENGFSAIGNILSGKVNPSGKLADTFVYDLTSTPAYANFGDFTYDNMDEYGWLEVNPFTGDSKQNDVNFVNYVENIYVGYKFYETAYVESQTNGMDFDYDLVVQYPFGYGLSYTSFDQKITEFVENENGFEMTVEVTNTGSVSGKDVVELYYNPPYTNGGIEKSAVNLLDFAKTGELKPGESQTVSFTVNAEDMASFDDLNRGCYVLENGNYEISIRSDAHNAIDSRNYNIASTIVYDESNPRSTDNTAATSQFDFAKGDDITYLSRANGFENYEEAVSAPTNYTMPEERKQAYQNITNYDIDSMNNPADEMPTTGANNGIKLQDLRGKDYDDPMWDSLLDELSVEDMTTLIAGGGYQTTAIESIGKVATTDNDGPATIYNNFTGATGNAYTTSVMLANTWNKEIARQMGESIGEEADEMDVSGWYAPAMNIHRTAFGGRNFEYYSEDGVLSGKIAAQQILGANEYGVYSYMKHFAMNDQETNRIYQGCTWSKEQAIRETYLKAFEIAVKEGSIGAVMDAHSYIGDRWCGSIYELNTQVLRNEWGFKGFVSTDMFAGYGYYDADMAIRAGVDSMLNPMGAPDATVTDLTSATSIKAMRQSCHNILYTVVNSRAYDKDVNSSMVLWKKILYSVDALVIVLLVVLEILAVRKYKKNK